MFMTGSDLGTSDGAILRQGMHIKFFSKVYCDRVYFLCTERFATGCIFCAPSGLRQGQVFDPQRHPPSTWKSSAPPPPPGNEPSLARTFSTICLMLVWQTTSYVRDGVLHFTFFQDPDDLRRTQFASLTLVGLLCPQSGRTGQIIGIFDVHVFIHFCNICVY